MNKTKKYVIIPIILLVIGFIVAIIFYKPQTNEETSTPYYQVPLHAGELNETQFMNFLTDQKRLVSLNLTPLKHGTRDAGEVLNRWIYLKGGASLKVGSEEAYAPDEEAYAPDEEAWWMDSAVVGSLNCAHKPPKFIGCMELVPEGDLNFMASLLAYDSWDLTSSGAWGRYRKAHPLEPPWSKAIPNYASLQIIAKLRLIHGLKTKNMLPALSEVRQLARLTLSNESLIGTMVAINIFRFEREAYEEALARKLISSQTWTPLSYDDELIFLHVLWTMRNLYSGLGPPDALARLQTAVLTPVALCPFGVNEANNPIAWDSFLVAAMSH